MGDNFVELEGSLIRGYQAQLEHYERAIGIVEQAAFEGATVGADPPWLRKLNAVLNELAKLDAALASERTAWRSAGRSPGAVLGSLLNQVAERIAKLQNHIDVRLRELQIRKQNLMPELDAFIQQRRMLQAYGKRR